MPDDIKLPKPFATLHDDGYWTMPRGAEPYESRSVGWCQHVYSADQLRAAVEADRLMPGAPRWTDGMPVNLPAAARDAMEWLLLIRSLHDAGRWPFSEPDSRRKLDGCIDALREHLLGKAMPTDESTQAGRTEDRA